MEVKETVIRLMTRLAIKHGAVNLSQGFTDEAPVYDMVWGGISAMLGGTEEGVRRLDSMTLRQILEERGEAGSKSLDFTLKELLARVRNPRDQLNQYSFPFGILELRHAIADYTQEFYGHRPDPEEQITVVLGASEGLAVAYRSLLDPGDGVVTMQPYHELYPSQAEIFGLVPRFVTLREDGDAGTWRLDRDEVRRAASDPSVRAFVVNTPHNPTGKVLNDEELSFIAEICRTYDLFAITDEIYEHIVFDGHRHSYLAGFEGMAERTLVVNSISKTGRSTGWRIGWVITPPERTRLLRAVHDNLVVQAPTPLQKGAVSLLRQEARVLRRHRGRLSTQAGPAARRPARGRLRSESPGGRLLPVRGLPERAGARGHVADRRRDASHQGDRGRDRAGRQLLCHRKRWRPLPAIRVLPLDRDDRGGSGATARQALRQDHHPVPGLQGHGHHRELAGRIERHRLRLDAALRVQGRTRAPVRGEDDIRAPRSPRLLIPRRGVVEEELVEHTSGRRRVSEEEHGRRARGPGRRDLGRERQVSQDAFNHGGGCVFEPAGSAGADLMPRGAHRMGTLFQTHLSDSEPGHAAVARQYWHERRNEAGATRNGNDLDEARTIGKGTAWLDEPAMNFGLMRGTSKTLESGQVLWSSENGIVSVDGSALDGSALFNLRSVDIGPA